MKNKNLKIKLSDGYEYEVNGTMLATFRAIELQKTDNKFDYQEFYEEVEFLLETGFEDLVDWVENNFDPDEIKSIYCNKTLWKSVESEIKILEVYGD